MWRYCETYATDKVLTLSDAKITARLLFILSVRKAEQNKDLGIKSL